MPRFCQLGANCVGTRTIPGPPYKVDQRFIAIFPSLPQEDVLAVCRDAIRTERVSRFQFPLRLFVCPAHRAPAHAGTDEGINETQFKKIAKAQSQLVLNRLQLTLPHGIGMMDSRSTLKAISPQPATNLANRDAGQPSRFRHCVEASVQEGSFGRIHGTIQAGSRRPAMQFLEPS